MHSLLYSKCIGLSIPSESVRKKLRYLTCYHLLIGHNSHYNPRRLCFRVIHALGGFNEIRGLGVGNVDEGLRIAISEWEPRALNLHHDAMATAEGVIDVLEGRFDLFHFARGERFWLFKTVAEFS